MAADEPWWGPFELKAGTMGRWQIGPRTLWLYHTAHEWRLFTRSGADSLQTTSSSRVPLPARERRRVLEGETEVDDVHRFSFRKTTAAGLFRPALADRPVVIRPEDPLSVPRGEEATLFVSTPLWIQFLVGTAEGTICEVSSHRLSDTWFGTSTRSGELSYAARTAGRMQLDDLPLRRHRAVTPLRLRNEADDPLHVERVQLPTPHLSLYETEDGFLWTEQVTMQRSRAAEGAEVTVADGPPAQQKAAERIASPRQDARKSLVVNTFRAIGALFSH
jgi:hypothetical protein